MDNVMELEEEILRDMSENPQVYFTEQPVIQIDNDLRTIIIPPSLSILGVESDDDVNRIHFKMPKMYGEVDLSQFDIRINYMNGTEGDIYVVSDKSVNDENIVFSWLVGRKAVQTKGDTSFIVCLKKTDSMGVVVQEFNTSVAHLNVLEGLETTEKVEQQNADIIEQILKKLNEVIAIPEQQIEQAVQKYLQEHPLTVEEQDPTVPEWAKEESKPKYSASEVGARPDTWMPSAADVGALPASTKIPAKLSDMEGDDTHRTVTDTEKEKWNGKSDFSGSYNELTDKPTIPSKLSELTNDSGYAKKSEVTQDIAGHNTEPTSHNDIRLLVKNLTDRLNTLANSDDVTLDQMSEVVAYIKNNKTLIDGITTSKVNVSDIINNLTTNLSNKPLSAAMGVELKKLIDAIKVPVNLSELAEDTTHRTVTDAEKTSWNNKSTFSGSYNDLTNKPSLFSGNYNDLSGKPTLITEERVNELITAKLPKSAEEVQY